DRGRPVPSAREGRRSSKDAARPATAGRSAAPRVFASGHGRCTHPRRVRCTFESFECGARSSDDASRGVERNVENEGRGEAGPNQYQSMTAVRPKGVHPRVCRETATENELSLSNRKPGALEKGGARGRG